MTRKYGHTGALACAVTVDTALAAEALPRLSRQRENGPSTPQPSGEYGDSASADRSH